MASKIKISIQGQDASYSHIAANHLFGEDIELINQGEFRNVFEDLETERADCIVVPIENSTYGSIYQNYDLLSKHGFEISGELYLKINFHLIAHPGTKISDLKEMYVHPVALGQIQSFIQSNPHIDVFEYEDTAGAIKMIKEEKLEKTAGAASRFAAEYYDMEILAENIHENPKNYTRFYLVTKSGKSIPEINVTQGDSRKFKTTIEFKLGEQPGSLYKSLRSFADRDISLSKIESRPIMNTDWEYRFYVDLVASQNDDSFANAFKELGDYVKDLKILGSYVHGEYIDT